MVLQDVASQSPDSFADEPYPSDNDPYSTSATTASPTPPQYLRINMDQLPRPIPIIGPLIGFSRAKSEKIVGSYLRTAMEMAGRQLSQEEATAMAYHIAKKESNTSYGATAGLSFGVWKWYQGRNVYRFPWYTPKGEWFDPSKLGPFTGQNARNLWHATRFIPFALLGLAGGQLLAWNWATASAAVGVQRDPKLKSFNEDLKSRLRERNANRERTTRGMESPAPSQQTPPPSWGRGVSTEEDDMSPTAGNDPWSNTQDTLNGAEDLAQRTSQSVQRSTASNQRDERTAETSSSWEDASPTGGLFETETRQDENSGGSAWERLRRNAAPGTSSNQPRPYNTPAQPVQREQREGSTLGDSFSFSSTDEERQLAKSEAQREFDERIERERRGGDFNDGRNKW